MKTRTRNLRFCAQGGLMNSVFKFKNHVHSKTSILNMTNPKNVYTLSNRNYCFLLFEEYNVNDLIDIVL